MIAKKVTQITGKEVSKMVRKYLIVSITLLSFLANVVPVAHAAGVLGSDTVAATASVSPIQTLSVLTKKVSDNSATTTPKTIAFGGLSGSVSNAPAYIEVSYACNSALWDVVLYTNNTTADGTVKKLQYQKAGLLKADNKDRVPLYWCVFDSVTTTLPTITLDENGVPVSRTPAKYPVGDGTPAHPNKVTDWAVLKDKNDLDDPTTTTVNESWIYAFQGDGGVTSKGGYTNIMYGFPGVSNLNAFPYYDLASAVVTGEWDPTGHNDNLYPQPLNSTLHRAATTPAYVYIAAGGGTASAGGYSTNIGLDLYQE